jgi:small subunit ribosomal protein S1
MNEPIDNQRDDQAGEEDFAAMLESYSADRNDDLRIGDQVAGRIIAIGADTVFVDTGTKVDGAVEKAELLDENGELPFKEGDTLTLFVVAMDESEVRLSKAITGVGGLNMLQEAMANEIPVEGKVTEPCKGGFVIEVLHRRAFCPVSQIDLPPAKEPAAYVGQHFHFMVSRVEKGGRNIVLSRRRLLEKEQEKTRNAFLATVAVGSVCEGTVVRVAPFGVFVQLAPGADGLVHVSEMSWSRVENPEDVVVVGQPVTVKILSIEPDKKPGQKRISLSMKQVGGDPWRTVAEKFKVHDTVEGKVTRCVKFGAFVEIVPGIEGLVHLSEMSYLRRITDPSEVVAPGAAVKVRIKAIEIDKRRISLSIREAQGDPWAEVETLFTVGKRVEGTLEKKERFGWFVQLAPGITGLMPKSRLATAPDAGRMEGLRPGDKLTVVVEEIHAQDRKITLAPDTGDEAVGSWQAYAAENPKPMGNLGEKLRRAISDHEEG